MRNFSGFTMEGMLFVLKDDKDKFDNSKLVCEIPLYQLRTKSAINAYAIEVGYIDSDDAYLERRGFEWTFPLETEYLSLKEAFTPKETKQKKRRR